MEVLYLPAPNQRDSFIKISPLELNISIIKIKQLLYLNNNINVVRVLE